LIRLTDITKEYRMGGEVVRALRGLSFHIKPNEFVAIMGPSGSGKSTAMNILGCLDKPTRGRYELAGEDVSRLSGDALAIVRNKRIGFVFQSFNLLASSSAADNVALPLMYSGARNARARAIQALDRVGLAHRANHRPMEMSGGQRQRVAIARALVTAPAVILADEPTGNLDTKTSIEILGLFLELHKEGSTIVMVTHEPDVAEYTQRIITVRDGALGSDAPVVKRAGSSNLVLAAAAQAGEQPT
jgi:putative ABC transport system ATP-binding protein